MLRNKAITDTFGPAGDEPKILTTDLGERDPGWYALWDYESHLFRIFNGIALFELKMNDLDRAAMVSYNVGLEAMNRAWTKMFKRGQIQIEDARSTEVVLVLPRRNLLIPRVQAGGSKTQHILKLLYSFSKNLVLENARLSATIQPNVEIQRALPRRLLFDPAVEPVHGKKKQKRS